MGLFGSRKSTEDYVSKADSYWNGNGVVQDHETAGKYYLKAAKQGHPGAIIMVAWMYENGDGFSQNYNEAIKWYNIAVNNGDTNAMLNLGNMYQNGTGVSVDYSMANALYERAVKGGNLIAAVNLGCNIYQGNGCTQSLEEGAKLLFWAHDNGYVHYEKMTRLGMLFENEDNIDMSAQCYRRALDVETREKLDVCFDAFFKFNSQPHHQKGVYIEDVYFSIINGVFYGSDESYLSLNISFFLKTYGDYDKEYLEKYFESLKENFDGKSSISQTESSSLGCLIRGDSLYYLGKNVYPVIRQYIVDYEARNPNIVFGYENSTHGPTWTFSSHLT